MILKTNVLRAMSFCNIAETAFLDIFCLSYANYIIRLKNG